MDGDPPAHPAASDASNRTAAGRVRHPGMLLERLARGWCEGSGTWVGPEVIRRRQFASLPSIRQRISTGPGKSDWGRPGVRRQASPPAAGLRCGGQPDPFGRTGRAVARRPPSAGKSTPEPARRFVPPASTRGSQCHRCPFALREELVYRNPGFPGHSCRAANGPGPAPPAPDGSLDITASLVPGAGPHDE